MSGGTISEVEHLAHDTGRPDISLLADYLGWPWPWFSESRHSGGAPVGDGREGKRDRLHGALLWPCGDHHPYEETQVRILRLQVHDCPWGSRLGVGDVINVYLCHSSLHCSALGLIMPGTIVFILVLILYTGVSTRFAATQWIPLFSFNSCVFSAFIIVSVLLAIFDKYSPYSYQNNRSTWDGQGEEPRVFTLKEGLWFCMTSLTPQGKHLNENRQFTVQN